MTSYEPGFLGFFGFLCFFTTLFLFVSGSGAGWPRFRGCRGFVLNNSRLLPEVLEAGLLELACAKALALAYARYFGWGFTETVGKTSDFFFLGFVADASPRSCSQALMHQFPSHQLHSRHRPQSHHNEFVRIYRRRESNLRYDSQMPCLCTIKR